MTNCHDMKMAAANLGSIAVAKRAPNAEPSQHICLDKGMTSSDQGVGGRWGYTAYILALPLCATYPLNQDSRLKIFFLNM